jgi:hypothetical protein
VDVSGGPRNGSIYVVWTNVGVPGVNTGDAEIYLIRSTDGGATWSTPVRVNNDATTNSQWFPWISCDRVTGDLHVVFYDRLADDPGNSLTTAYVAHSTDGGATGPTRASATQFTPTPLPATSPPATSATTWASRPGNARSSHLERRSHHVLHGVYLAVHVRRDAAQHHLPRQRGPGQ